MNCFHETDIKIGIACIWRWPSIIQVTIVFVIKKTFATVCQFDWNYSFINVLIDCSIEWLTNHSFSNYPENNLAFFLFFLMWLVSHCFPVRGWLVWVGDEIPSYWNDSQQMLMWQSAPWSLIPPPPNCFSISLRIECNLYFSIGLANDFVKVIFDWKKLNLISLIHNIPLLKLPS